jgi:hypothetical protein
MKKLIVFFVVILNLQASAAEQIKILCSGAKGEVSIVLKEHCLSMIVKKNVITWGPEYDCPRGPCSGSTTSQIPDHSFSTCRSNPLDEEMTKEEINSRSGKWISYNANAEECLRPGCIGYKAYFSLMDKKQEGLWKLDSLATTKVGTGYYQFNEHYDLPRELKGLSCKKL